jgi:hypothetical protein
VQNDVYDVMGVLHDGGHIYLTAVKAVTTTR